MAKNNQTLAIAWSDEDTSTLDTFRLRLPFAPSRSETARACIRYALAMVIAGAITLETIGEKFSKEPIAAPAPQEEDPPCATAS